jgi:GT2 family glycosyltransferase/tetratricopeptide (TPR) repeat protein
VLTSIVIATFNKLDYTKQCIESIRQYTQPGSYEIIVVDNGSTDGSAEWLREQPDVRVVLNGENLGFPKACNQGIGISTGENILLLNNDTIVTENWLTNLLAALYSGDGIGAVGAVTNSCSYGQAIPVSYSSLADMHEFARQHNQSSNPASWEERLKLIGYCMLIKKPVLDQVGLLDERFTPGNYEDDDLSLRIRLAGYKLLLCRDTFIHHYGSASFREAPPEYVRLMQGNRMKFQEKWGFDPDSGNHFRLDVCGLVQGAGESPIRVLEIGCGCGGNLLQIRHRFPNAELVGTEPNEAAAQVAGMLGEIHVGDLQQILMSLPEAYFDWIVVSEKVSRWESPLSLLVRLRSLLNERGRLLAAVPNALFHVRIKPMLLGVSSPRTNDGFTVSETESLFAEAGFTQVKLTALVSPQSESDKAFIRSLAAAAGIQETVPYEIAEFLVEAAAWTESARIKGIVNDLISQNNTANNARLLAAQDLDLVLSVIEQSGHEQKNQLINFLAVQLLENGEGRRAQQYLQAVFEEDPGNPQTIFNLGMAMYMQGQSELALEWFELLPEKSEQVQNWMEKIRQEIISDKYQHHRVRFLLRRMEWDLDGESSQIELLRLLSDGDTTVEELEREATAGVVRKADLISRLALACLEREMFDWVVPLFEAALRMDPNHSPTLYHLAAILAELGERDAAQIYLDRIGDTELPVDELRLKIRGQLA